MAAKERQNFYIFLQKSAFGRFLSVKAFNGNFGLFVGYFCRCGALTDLKKNDVQCFLKGNTDGKFICYYPYWIKHLPSDTAEDVMEFGIVRNNVYQVTVASIQGVGKDGVTENIITDTETDDPTTVLLNVKLSIKPWIVRTNSAVLGR